MAPLLASGKADLSSLISDFLFGLGSRTAGVGRRVRRVLRSPAVWSADMRALGSTVSLCTVIFSNSLGPRIRSVLASLPASNAHRGLGDHRDRRPAATVFFDRWLFSSSFVGSATSLVEV